MWTCATAILHTHTEHRHSILRSRIFARRKIIRRLNFVMPNYLRNNLNLLLWSYRDDVVIPNALCLFLLIVIAVTRPHCQPTFGMPFGRRELALETALKSFLTSHI
jgi:hypothetical protein